MFFRLGGFGTPSAALQGNTPLPTLKNSAASPAFLPFSHSHTDPMSDPYFQARFADRIGGPNYGKGTEIYKFEKIKRAKRKALAEHPERSLVDFGIGENDEMRLKACAAC